MSIVGTRPPTLDEWNKYELHHRARLAIKPGITGMWQVSGRSEITDFEEVVKLDTEYISEWNVTIYISGKRYQNIAVNIVEFIDTVADAIGEQLIENRFIQLMSIYRSKKSKGELYKHAICKAQIIVSYVKGSTYFT